MESSNHILVVDDHRDIRDSLSKYLAQHEYRTSVAADAVEARQVIDQRAIDLVVLDIMMPGEDGLSLCRHIRQTTELPVILLTAIAEDTERVIGLEMGADDYLTKPFNPRELLARIKSVLRRTHSLPPRSTPTESDKIKFDKWIFDVAQREVIGEDNVAIPLSTAEYHLLNAFLDHPKMVLSRDQLLDITSGRSAKVFDRAIDNQVSRLRKKLEDDPKSPTLIKTVWGGGYMLTVEVER
jgi:two-component system OmpR family response regulator|tara:strand:+ start:921 stop:1637 length:717 start_codon:yes stop_codon:yes gene_type:complete